MKQKLTLRDLRKRYRDGQALVALTAYDAAIGGLADHAGVDIILVGDSVGMTHLGYKNTISVTLEQSLHHTAAVVRGVERAFVVGDMPFLTFQITPEEALRNAGRYLQEAGADAVKLEGGQAMAGTVARLVDAGIPVLGHIGLLPQQVMAEGGYRVHGRKAEEADALLQDAEALQQAGAFGIVLEGLPTALSKRITEQLNIPTIGIGAGAACSGQIQVVDDVLGLFESFVPKHAKQYAQLAELIREALSEYANDVSSGSFPGPEHSFD